MSGCDLAKPKNKGQTKQPVVQEDPQPVAVPPQADPAEDNTVLTKVDANVGVQGKSLAPATGNNPVEIITVPVRTLFLARDRIQIMNLDKAMKEYRGFNDGNVPANQQEFDEKIIRAYNIKLPPLRPDQKYVYDPTDGELKVSGPMGAP